MSGDISGRLARLAQSQPANIAIISGGESISFQELEDRCSRLARGLARAGIGPGARAALMVPPGIDFVALAFALFRAGAVPVLIDPGMGRQNIRQCLAEAAPEAFIGAPKAHAARLLEGWGKETVRTLVTVGRRLFWGGTELSSVEALGAQAAPLPPAGPLAAILFTSGSTGLPKGVVYTHAIFEAQARLLSERFSIEPGGVSMPTFPLFALFDVALGLTALIPRMDATRPGSVDPMAVIGPIQKHGAVQLFGSPALLDRVGRFGARHGIFLPSLRRVLCSGAPAPAATLARFVKLLPASARIFTPYGATEALPVAVLDSAEILGETAALSAQGKGTCVGRPFPGMDVRVIGLSDGPIAAWSDGLLSPDGEIGELVVRGPVVTSEYFRRPEATALSKISGEGNAFWHRMGDLGYRDAQGRFWFCGRKSQRVTTPEATLFTIPCEAVFNNHPGVRRTALVGVGPAGRQRPVLCVELEEGQPLQQRVLAERLLLVGGAFPHTRSIRTILFHPSFPVDIRHNAKIFREKLAAWAEAQLR